MSDLKSYGQPLTHWEKPRCPICDWPLAPSPEKGCVAGNCSYRPEEGSPEWHRLQARKRNLTAARS